MMLLQLLLLHLWLALGASALYLTRDSYAPCSYSTGIVNLLDCANKGLTAVPGVDPAMAVSAFYLDGNEIKTIEPNAFVNMTRTLTMLSIKSTTAAMDRIETGAFSGLTVLKSLTVEARLDNEASMNTVQITNILKDLTALNSLHMKHINVKELPISFAGSTSLVDLALINTAISSIDRNAFANASHLRSLDLSYNALTSTNWLGSATNLETCVLVGCSLNPSTLGQIPALPRLTQLNLQKNNLDRLVSNAFENVAGTLTDLVLSFNDISEANTQGLAGLTGLKKLAMSNNRQLTAIPPQVRQMPALESAEFRETRIAGIEADAFHPNARLKVLKLDNTHVSSLHALTFSRLTSSLEEFTLFARNLHTAVLQDTTGQNYRGNWSIILDHLPELQILYLGGTSADETGGLGDNFWPSLRKLKRLRRLRLDYNQITGLPDFYLDQFANLTYLSLYGNRVSAITSAALYNKGGMQLELQNNAIKAMDNCTLAMYANVSGIDLSGNPFDCNCALQWLWQRVKSDQPLKLPSTKCDQPASLAGRSWNTLAAGDFCSPGEVPPNNCSVITPPITPTPEPSYLLSITVANAGDSSVSLTSDVAKLVGQFDGYVVKYWPVSRPEATANSSRLAIATSTVTLQVAMNELYRYCYVLLNDATSAAPVDSPENCRDFTLQGLASAAIIAIAVLAAIIGIAVIFVVVCLLCKRCRSRTAANNNNKANIQSDEDPYTYTYPDMDGEGQGTKKKTKKKKAKTNAANGSSSAAVNSQFQATLRPESKRFSKRSRNNLAGSRPSLATSTTTLAASRLSSPGPGQGQVFAVPNGSRPVSDHATASQQQQRQQHQHQQSNRSLHSIADDQPPADWRHHGQLSRSQDHLSSGNSHRSSQQRMLPPPPSIGYQHQQHQQQQPLRQARSQELVLDVTRVSSHQPPLPPQPPPVAAARFRQQPPTLSLTTASPAGDYLPMISGGGYTDMASAAMGGESSTDDYQHRHHQHQQQQQQYQEQDQQYERSYNDYVQDEDTRGSGPPATVQPQMSLLTNPGVRISGGGGGGGVDNSAFGRNEAAASGYYEMGQF